MNRKRIVIGMSIIVFVLALVIGRIILLNSYRQKADVALFLTGDYKKAILYYNKLIWWKPSNANLYFNRGDAFNYDKQYDQAISDYKKAIELSPYDLQAYLRLGLMYKDKEDNDSAETTFRTLLDLSKNSEVEYWAANYHLGQISFRKKRYRQALEFYKEAIATSETDLNLYHRANAYYALRIEDSAILDYNKSIGFVKADYVRKHPDSQLAACDTCGFLFGTREYELLTDSDHETLIQTLEKVKNNKEVQELNEKLKQTEESNH